MDELVYRLTRVLLVVGKKAGQHLVFQVLIIPEHDFGAVQANRGANMGRCLLFF